MRRGDSVWRGESRRDLRELSLGEENEGRMQSVDVEDRS